MFLLLRKRIGVLGVWAAFLRIGDLDLDGNQFADNYNLALYRPITEEEFQAVLNVTIPYLETGEKYAPLYSLHAVSTDPMKKPGTKRKWSR